MSIQKLACVLFLSLNFGVPQLQPPLAADILFYESFDYTTGDPLNGLNGGTGFKSAWSGDSQFEISELDFSYQDSQGNLADIRGKTVAGQGGIRTTVRELNVFDGAPSEIWGSIALTGRDGSAAGFANFSIEEKIFIGQGYKDTQGTHWALSDDSGSLADSGVEATGDAFLITKMTCDSDDKLDKIWVWLNPDIESMPDVSSSFTGASGIDVTGTGAICSKISFGLGDESTGISHILFGTSFEDVNALSTAVPEPGTAFLTPLVLGLLYACRRRKKGPATDPLLQDNRC